MKTTLGRVAGVVGLAAASAVVAGVLVAPSASASINAITPGTAFNTESAKALAFTFDGKGGTYFLGGSASFVRQTGRTDTFTLPLDAPSPPDASGKTATASLDARDRGDGLGVDGPLNAGVYDVTSTSSGPMGATDACTACFTVQREGAVAVSGVSPSSVRAGNAPSGGQITVTGNNFERGARIDFLLPGTTTVDPLLNANQLPVLDDGNPSTTNDSTNGITTRTTLKRTVSVDRTAATGARDVRVTLVDGSSAVLARSFSVDGAPLTSVSPTGGNNDPALGATRVTLTGTGLSTTGSPRLLFSGDPGSSTRDQLTVIGKVVGTPTVTTYVMDVELGNAAPGSYLPSVLNRDGSSNTCTCTYSVAQAPSRATSVKNLDSDPATAGLQKSQAAGTTKTFLVTGTGFARGTRVTVGGAGVTTTAVQFLDATQLLATLQSTPTAALGDRTVTATRTDGGGASTPCAACYTVTAPVPASPTPTPTPTPTTTVTPSPSATPSVVAKPTIRVDPTTIVAVQQKATVSGVSTPGATLEVYAYSRPSTTFTKVRSAVIGPDGTYAFVVGPSGNTRLFARTVTPRGSADSDSLVLTVRTSLNLKVVRTGTRTYRFTGSLLPKRPGQLITVFYERADGNRVIAARARNAADGTYNVSRTFTGGGTVTLFTGTGTDNNNAANNSNRVRVTLR